MNTRAWWAALRRYFLEHPVEPILNPIPSRLMVLGCVTAIGHLIYFLAWRHLEPIAYESLPLRLFMAGTGLVFMIPAFHNNPESTFTKALYVFLVFLQVPFFFFFMYLMNEAGRNWLASAALIIVALYSLTDWRVASVQILLGIPAAAFAWLLMRAPGQANPVAASDLLVMAFSVVSGLLLATFSASTRQLRLKHSNEVMGILAHELRTPLSANGLLAEAILAQCSRVEQPEVRKSFERLGRRVQAVTDAMNHHIDLQIINARMLHIPKFQERIQISDLLHSTVAQYPFRSKSHRECLKIVIENDFAFIGSMMYFRKVVDNLISNAVKSLQTAGSDFSAGKIVLAASVQNGKGVFSVVDQGMGVEPANLSRLFAPYFSTDQGGNHGLGLFFCRRVVEHANGTISVKSAPLIGAKFEIRLPIASEARSPWRLGRSQNTGATPNTIVTGQGQDAPGYFEAAMSEFTPDAGADTVTQPLPLG